jgi:hypothetical protein
MRPFENIQIRERFSKDTNLKNEWQRGSKHFIYMNRTFGLYNLMFDLKAKIVVNQYKKYHT